MSLQLMLQSLDDPSVVGSPLLQAVETSMTSSDSEASLVDVVSAVMNLLNVLLRRAGSYMVSWPLANLCLTFVHFRVYQPSFIHKKQDQQYCSSTNV